MSKTRNDPFSSSRSLRKVWSWVAGTAEPDKTGHVLHCVDHGVHLDAAFLFPVDRIAPHALQDIAEKADSGRIDNLEVFYREAQGAAVRQKLAVPGQKRTIDGGEDPTGAVGVGNGKCASPWKVLKAQMAELALAGEHSGREFPQRAYATKSRVDYRDQVLVGLAGLVITVAIEVIPLSG